MSQPFAEGDVSFAFPNGWHVCRPGQTSFYKRHFQRFAGGTKEVDFLLFNPQDKDLWFVEVKDYRAHPRAKQTELADEVAQKTRDSLALLKAAAVRDTNTVPDRDLQLGTFARVSAQPSSIRVVLHCELPATPSRLFPGIKDAANLQAKLKQQLHAVDPHPIFTNSVRPHSSLPWTASV